MAMSTFKRNIGIVGIHWSGKTVFLMSLLSHLKNHDENKLQLKTKNSKPAQIIKLKEVAEGIDLPFFELEKYRNRLLANKAWPNKTADSCYYRCQFERTDWMSNVDLTFLDFPGERFNDAIMLIDKGSYEEWSDTVLKRIEEDPHCERLAEEYFQVLAEEQPKVSPDIGRILLAYKRTLARFMLNYGAFITPSIFALDTQGKQPKYSDNLDEIAASALIGRTTSSEFAPLPASFREKNPLLTSLFSSYYQNYRHEIVEKPFKNLSKCDKLLVLIDVPGLLAANVGRYNDTQTILSHVLKATLKDSSNLFTGLMNLCLPGSMRMSHLESIAFIATKADMVNYADTDNLKKLLQEMIKNTIKDYPHIKYDYFVCSAIKSTVMKDGMLLGYPMYDVHAKPTRQPHPDDLMTELKPSKLPDAWPHYWETHKYYFPEVWPSVPFKKDVPPNQNGLDGILSFIFEK